MPLYEYHCDSDGPFERLLALGAAPPVLACPACGRPARRVFTAPLLRTGRRSAWTAALDHADKSRHEPEVVGSLPAPARAARPQAPLNPALYTLPRP